MVDKKCLIQYMDLLQEEKEVQKKIDRLEAEIARIENEGTVKDKVMGGEGGWQHFEIEGVPTQEYSRKKTMLYSRMTTLQLLKDEITMTLNEVESFIRSVEDSYMRRIINLRVVEQLSWKDVAAKMGAGYSEDSIRMSFERFMKK